MISSPVVLIVLLVALVVVVYWIVLKNSSKSIARQFVKLSEGLELELNAPGPIMGGFIRPEPSVYGEHGGREISISVPGKGMQNTRQIETVLKLQLKNESFAAQVAASGILGGIRQRDGRGLQRWRSGEKAFDASWDVRARPEQDTASVFTPEIRTTMSELLKEGKGNLYIGRGVMAYAELGLISKDATRERFERMIAFLSDLGDTIGKD